MNDYGKKKAKKKENFMAYRNCPMREVTLKKERFTEMVIW